MEKAVDKRKESFDLYIGRGSKWGNPFKIGANADGCRDDVLRMYKRYLIHGGGRALLADIEELEGLTLGCFCAPAGGLSAHDPLRCHGQLLLEALEVKKQRRRGEEYG